MKYKNSLLYFSLVFILLVGTVFAGSEVPKNLKKINFPPITVSNMDNGLKLYTLEHHEQPVVLINVMIKAGSAQDSKGKGGEANLTAKMLRDGTPKLSRSEISKKIDFMGAEYSAETKKDSTEIQIKILKKHFPDALNLISEMIMKPEFPEKEFKRRQKNIITSQLRNLDDISMLADKTFSRELMGDYPYAHSPKGTPESLINITPQDIQNYYSTYYSPNNTVIVVAGDIDPEKIENSVSEEFKKWEEKEIPETDFDLPESPEGYEIVLLDKPDATQAQIRMGHFGIKRNNDDFQAVKLANNMLGRGFESRLVKAVRAKKGLTYDVRSSFSVSLHKDSFKIQTFTKNKSTGEALQTIIDVLKKIRKEGYTSEELELTQAYYSGVIAVGMETPSDLASRLQYLELMGLDRDYIRNYRHNIYRVSLEETNEAFKKYVDPENMTIVAVGNAEVIKPQLEEYGEMEVRPYLDQKKIKKIKSKMSSPAK